MLGIIRRFLFGAPLPSSRALHERLPKILALPVFSSDAVSSVAYGPEEVLIALMVLGGASWIISVPIGLAIAGLILIVSTSYRQTVNAYPHGGGSYTVAKENLGTFYGLIAAASLLTDYILTVAVSVAAGVAAVISMRPEWAPYTTTMGVIAVFLVAYMNLRGLRESGALFAPPTYGFILSLYILVGVGLYKVFAGPHIAPIVTHPLAAGHEFYGAKGMPWPGLQSISLFIVLRAFASGCAALTGIEAIANGVPAFKPPESKNAATTMVYMSAILASLVVGVTLLAHYYHAYPSDTQTLVSQVASSVFGRGWFYIVIQVATALILILAANTAFQDFPRLSSILARDRFAPRQLANIGDKLVYSNGILLLSAIAALLIVVFHGDTTRLIPLYAVGVFISFTLSQYGMGFRQKRLKHEGWKLHSAISFFGGTITGVVAIVIGATKFVHGAWIVVLLIPILVYIFHKIHQHYIEMGTELRLTDADLKEPAEVKSTSIVLAAGIHRGVLPALKYARSLSHDCRALYVEIDPSDTPLVRERWEKFGQGVPLVILESPFRSMIGPV
ncbi:APC family permease, partial [bacterium]|nr:APC family permease [bacterium]